MTSVESFPKEIIYCARDNRHYPHTFGYLPLIIRLPPHTVGCLNSVCVLGAFVVSKDTC
jgi:hypothetical protein